MKAVRSEPTIAGQVFDHAGVRDLVGMKQQILEPVQHILGRVQLVLAAVSVDEGSESGQSRFDVPFFFRLDA